MAKKEVKNLLAKKRVKRKINEGIRGVSPIISTIILIMIVLIIAIIIVLFARSWIKEIILKEVAGNSRRVEDFCSDAKNGIKPILNEDGTFGISNEGNIPIYGVILKTSKAGDSETIRIGDLSINPGYSKMIEGYGVRSDYEEVKIIPILLGKRKNELLEPYTCSDNYGVEI